MSAELMLALKPDVVKKLDAMNVEIKVIDALVWLRREFGLQRVRPLWLVRMDLVASFSIQRSAMELTGY